MGDQPFPWRKTFVLGFGFFGISIVWPIFNSFIPPMLEKLSLTAGVIGLIMTWDNLIKARYGFQGVRESGKSNGTKLPLRVLQP